MEPVMANVDLGKYRRIVQMFWDPEPANDRDANRSVWCLGSVYTLSESQGEALGGMANDEDSREGTEQSTTSRSASRLPESGTGSDSLTPPLTESIVSKPGKDSLLDSFSQSFAYEKPDIEDRGWPRGFLDDFDARFWMTYRSGFEAIPKSLNPKASSALSIPMRIRSQLVDQSGFTSDSGWGCMIRSGQSLLANAMASLRLGRDWRRGSCLDEERQIISEFADDRRAPYSIHSFVQHGERFCGKYPGEWFGPSATARCIQDLVNDREPHLRVYSTGDGPDVYEDSFMRIAKPDGDIFHPTLILVGTRLGIDKITPVYWEALIASLQMTHSIGIAGGRPSSSHYFVGAQGHYLFYLDPHHTRAALPYHADKSKYTNEDIDSCHTSRLRKIHVKEMDPSMLIGFLIRNATDWDEWRRCVKHVQGKAIIHVSDFDPATQLRDGSGRSAIDEVEFLSDDEGDATMMDTAPV